MTRISRLKLGAAALAALTALAASPVAAEDWRGWNIHPPTYPNGIALDVDQAMRRIREAR